MKFYYLTNIFNLQFFDKETILFKFLKIFMEMHYISLFFLNEGNITTSLLMLYLKYTVVHYANINLSSINKPFVNLRDVEYAISFFFCFLFIFILMRLSSNTLLKKLSFSNKNFQYSSENVAYYRILGCKILSC